MIKLPINSFHFHFLQAYRVKSVTKRLNCITNDYYSKQKSKNQYFGKLYPVTEDTFLYCRILRQENQVENNVYNVFKYINAHLVHCDQNGNVLFQYPLIQKQESFSDDNIKLSVFSESKVLLLLPQLDRLIQIHLRTHEIIYFRYKFTDHYKVINLHIFYETNVVCIEEKGKDDLRLTYFNLPLHLGCKPIAIYNCKFQVQHVRVIKANNHSMVVWFNLFFKKPFILNIFDLRDYPEGKYYRIQTQQSPCIFEQKRVIVNSVWERKLGEFLLHICASRLCETKIMKLKVQNNSICETQIDLDLDDKDWYPYEKCRIIYNLGQFCWMDLFMDWQKQCLLQYSLCFQNQTQQLIEVQANKSYLQKHNNMRPRQTLYRFENQQSVFQDDLYLTTTYLFNPNLIYILQYTTRYKIFTTVQLFSRKQVALHFLIHLNEDFDDDLLKDAVELIDYTQRKPVQEQKEKQETQQ